MGWAGLGIFDEEMGCWAGCGFFAFAGWWGKGSWVAGVWIQKACLLEMLDACVLLVLLVDHDWCGAIKDWLGRAGQGRAELSNEMA